MREITLSQGKVALVSDDDFERVSAFKWYASQEGRGGLKWYAVRKYRQNGRFIKIRMHRLIMGLGPGPRGPVVDHLNGDGLDNRRENLEIISQEENMLRAPRWGRRKMEEPCL